MHVHDHWQVPQYLAAGDLDGDGDLDVVLVQDNLAVKTFANDGGPNSFTGFTRTDGGKLAANRHNPLLLDADGDGDIDMISASGIGSMFYRNDGTGAVSLEIRGLT